MPIHPSRAYAYRIQCGALIEAVLDETVTPRTAIHTWPMLGNEDPSLQCAYTILWYAESDEDRVHEVPYYSDLQLQHLQEITVFLKQGQPIPDRIIAQYVNQVASLEYDGNWTWRDFVWRARRWADLIEAVLMSNPFLERFINQMAQKIK